MKPVKMCYKIKYCLKKCGIELRDSCFEILITWYYRIFKRRKQGISPGNKRRRKVIVSMTSIPARIDKVWITVESLLRQTYKPDEIIVWLALDEFEKQYGYAMTAEDFINKGQLHVTHMPGTERKVPV